MRALLVLALLFSARSVADACKIPDAPSRFEMADEADTVVIGTPVKSTRDGKVTFVVDTVVKGMASKTITLHTFGTDCDPFFHLRKRTVVWLKNGKMFSSFRSTVLVEKQPWRERLVQWVAAANDTTRARVLADTIANGGRLAEEAIFTLHDEVLAALATEHIATIAGAWPRLSIELRNRLLSIEHRDLARALNAAAKRHQPKAKPV